MRIFLLLLALLVHLSAAAQTIVLPHPDSIATKEWVRSLLRGETPQVPTVPATPTLEPCKQGPDLRAITHITSTSATFRFHGEGVYELQWEVVGTAYKGKVKPTSAEILIAYNLPAGTYTLRIEGTSCAGVSTKSFTIAEKVGVQVPPAVPSTVKPLLLTQGYSQHIDIAITGSSNDWQLTDLAPVRLPDGYEWWYFIGGDLLKQDQPLTNYRYQTNAPLRVLKMAGKKGLRSFNYWGIEDWQDKDAGWSFNRNISSAFQTWVFTGDTPIDAQVHFQNVVPHDFAFDGFQQWHKLPAVKLPKGHLYHLRKIKPSDSVESLLGKGVTHISNYDLPWHDHSAVDALRRQGVSYNDVPNNSHIFNLPDHGTGTWINGYNTRHWPTGELNEAQARAAARQTSWADHAVWIGQTEEGEAYMPADRPMWGWFYDELKKVYEERFGSKGIPYYIAHNYFWIGQPKGFDLSQCNRAEAKAARKQVPTNRYSPGHSLQNTNLIIEGIYNSYPDGSLALFDKLHKLELFEKMGKKGILFAFGVHEWRPNNYYKIDMPEGTLYRQDKIPVDPNYLLSASFFSQIYGHGIFEWGPVPSEVVEKKPLYPDQFNADKWHANGSAEATAFHWYSYKDYYSIYTGSTDLIHLGQVLYSETFYAFHEQPLQYARFRIDGGEWINPTADGSDVIDAYYDSRALVGYKVKNGEAALFYCSPRTNGIRKQLEVEINNHVYTTTVAGTGVHATTFKL